METSLCQSDIHSLAPPRIVATPVTRTSPHPGFSPLPRATHPMPGGHGRPQNMKYPCMFSQVQYPLV
ncbi:hypothetical protein BDR05DRAFT_967830 [Suillus weaverae]|nr:hypothetical protein BDR05DRAFT_967830 [Suillus weaverae]